MAPSSGSSLIAAMVQMVPHLFQNGSVPKLPLRLIESTSYGYAISLSGIISDADALRFVQDIQYRTEHCKTDFSVVFDFRDIDPLSEKAKNMMAIAFTYLKGRGMKKSAVLYDTHAQISDLAEVAYTAGLQDQQRYFSSLAFSEPTKEALYWIKNAN